MESIGCAKAKAVKLMDTLEDWGLIRRARARQAESHLCSRPGIARPVRKPNHFIHKLIHRPVRFWYQFGNQTGRKSNRFIHRPVWFWNYFIHRLVRLSNPRSLIFKPQKFGNRTLIRLSIIRLIIIRLKGQREKRKSRLWSAVSWTKLQRKFFAEVLTKP